MSRYLSTMDVKISVSGMIFYLNKDLLALRSSGLRSQFQKKAAKGFQLGSDMTSPHTFETIARFCYGLQVDFTPENIIPISCLALCLDMNDSHSPNNLWEQAKRFFFKTTVTGWNESLRALKAMENHIDLNHGHYFIGKCMDSIVSKALSRPLLLGEPVNSPIIDDTDDENDHDDSANDEGKDGDSEENDVIEDDLSLTTLHLQFYEPIILKMVQSKMNSDNIASNLYQYAKRWVFVESREYDENTSSQGVCSTSRKAIIEAIERLLPHDQSILSCASLSKMLHYATLLEANAYCRDGFEVRIGRQLDIATVNDLLIPTQRYSKEEKYDTERVKRILKHFYNNFTGQDQSGLDIVAELLEDFLGEVANDIDLKKDSFISLAEMAIAASEETQRSSDGIYGAIDIYLSKHRYLTESEREEICAVLDCNKMSAEACEHAAQNERIPVRVTVQVLFKWQLHLRETITKELAVQSSKGRTETSRSTEENEVIDKEGRVQLEKMSSRVTELENECLMLKNKIEKGCCSCKKMENENENANVLAGNEDETSVHEEGSTQVEGNENSELCLVQ